MPSSKKKLEEDVPDFKFKTRFPMEASKSSRLLQVLLVAVVID